MAEGINVRISGKLRDFINRNIGEDGLYENASEYIRNLIRLDYERNEAHKWNWLYEQLSPGIKADESEFVDFNPEKIIAKAKKENAKNAS